MDVFSVGTLVPVLAKKHIDPPIALIRKCAGNARAKYICAVRSECFLQLHAVRTVECTRGSASIECS
jgi:hypothetical protein